MSDEKKAAAPIIIIRPRRTNRYCGQCGKVIALADKQCKTCGTPIDWSVYRKETNR